MAARAQCGRRHLLRSCGRRRQSYGCRSCVRGDRADGCLRTESGPDNAEQERWELGRCRALEPELVGWLDGLLLSQVRRVDALVIATVSYWGRYSGDSSVLCAGYRIVWRQRDAQYVWFPQYGGGTGLSEKSVTELHHLQYGYSGRSSPQLYEF